MRGIKRLENRGQEFESGKGPENERPHKRTSSYSNTITTWVKPNPNLVLLFCSLSFSHTHLCTTKFCFGLHYGVIFWFPVFI